MLKQRFMVGLPFGLIALCAFVLPGWTGAAIFTAIALCMLVLALREYFAITRKLGCVGFPNTVLMAGLALVLLTALTAGRSGFSSILLSHQLETLLLVAVIIVGFSRVYWRGAAPKVLLDLLVSVGGYLYVCWTLNFIVRLYFSSGFGPSGRFLALFLVGVTKLGDVGAFAVGKIGARRPGGNHALVPRLSPQKSWEGFVGGVLASVAAAMLFAAVGRGGSGGEVTFSALRVRLLSPANALFLGVLFAVLGVVGDLAESALKRAAGVKDSGKLPGLGGVLDTVDSLMLVAPVFYCYVYLCSIW